ncbi:hypothetical protein BMETH_1479_0 [methanotrophic bacterial endosymbiont of Bathymodiolus sp.]|nr:hypothetical protein BMETH_1479_0 [methanotrophic bacterial endosymbiont of Bathymodiolus sp.]
MTEVGCYYSMNSRYGQHKPRSMGKSCPLTQIRIVDEKGAQLPQGEILISIPLHDVDKFHFFGNKS